MTSKRGEGRQDGLSCDYSTDGSTGGRCQEGRPSVQPLTTRDRDETGTAAESNRAAGSLQPGVKTGYRLAIRSDEAQRIRPIQHAKHLHAGGGHRGYRIDIPS
jgi:hypothetical protein